jgi:hypothetical protein
MIRAEGDYYVKLNKKFSSLVRGFSALSETLWLPLGAHCKIYMLLKCLSNTEDKNKLFKVRIKIFFNP